MFQFTKSSLENFISQVICYTAKELGIQNAEWKSLAELEKEISDLDSTAFDLMVKFIGVYRDWYDYNYDKNGNGINNLPDQSKAENLMNERDAKRDALLNRIK